MTDIEMTIEEAMLIERGYGHSAGMAPEKYKPVIMAAQQKLILASQAALDAITDRSDSTSQEESE